MSTGRREPVTEPLVTVTSTRPLKPGDLFYDGEGVIWVAHYNGVKPPTNAGLVWHRQTATASREGEDEAEIATLALPFTLITALGDL